VPPPSQKKTGQGQGNGTHKIPEMTAKKKEANGANPIVRPPACKLGRHYPCSPLDQKKTGKNPEKEGLPGMTDGKA
jgi:hypothetical protein